MCSSYQSSPTLVRGSNAPPKLPFPVLAAMPWQRRISSQAVWKSNKARSVPENGFAQIPRVKIPNPNVELKIIENKKARQVQNGKRAYPKKRHSMRKMARPKRCNSEFKVKIKIMNSKFKIKNIWPLFLILNRIWTMCLMVPWRRL